MKYRLTNLTIHHETILDEHQKTALLDRIFNIGVGNGTANALAANNILNAGLEFGFKFHEIPFKIKALEENEHERTA